MTEVLTKYDFRSIMACYGWNESHLTIKENIMGTYILCLLIVIFVTLIGVVLWQDRHTMKDGSTILAFCLRMIFFGSTALMLLVMAVAMFYDKTHNEPIRNHEDAIGVRMTITKISHFQRLVNDSLEFQSWEVYCKGSVPGHVDGCAFYTADSATIRAIAVGDTGRAYNLNRQWKSAKYPRKIIFHGRVVSTEIIRL